MIHMILNFTNLFSLHIMKKSECNSRKKKNSSSKDHLAALQEVLRFTDVLLHKEAGRSRFFFLSLSVSPFRSECDDRMSLSS